MSVFDQSQDPSSVASDEQGGLLVVWNDQRNGLLGTSQDIYAQRLMGDGTIAPGWAVNGVAATRAPDYQTNPVIAPDGLGGAFVVWEDWRDFLTNDLDVYLQHLTTTGGVENGWPADGLRISAPAGGQSSPFGIVPDGAGGVVVVWTDTRNGGPDVYAQRVLADGTFAPGWDPAGVPVMLGHVIRDRDVAPDGAGGFYVGCATVLGSADQEYAIQRFTFSGVRAAGWPAGGVRACGAPGDRYGLHVVPDGVGGLLLTWYDYRPSPTGSSEIYAARVLPDGSLAPGWTVDGVRLSDDTASGNEFDPNIAPDGLGGAYVVWEREDFSGRPSLVQHLTATGTVAPGWPLYGLHLAATLYQFYPEVVEDGAGGAFVVWEEHGGPNNRFGLFAQRFSAGSPTPVLVSLVSTDAQPDHVLLIWQVAGVGGGGTSVYRRTAASGWEILGAPTTDGPDGLRYEDRTVSPGERYAYRLGYSENGAEQFSVETWVEIPALRLALEGLRPNPAVGELVASLTLPSAAPARLQLLDVTGRVWLAREVGALGAGNHLVRLNGDAPVPAGMYWLRLTQSGRSLLARGVIVR